MLWTWAGAGPTTELSESSQTVEVRSRAGRIRRSVSESDEAEAPHAADMGLSRT